MRNIKFSGYSSLIFVLCHTVIEIFSIIDHDLFSLIQFHHSNGITWWLIYFIVPIIISLLLGLSIYKKLKDKKLLSVIAIINLAILIIVNVSIGVASKNYWGYSFKRPAIFKEVESALKVEKASTIYSIDKDGRKEFILDTVKIDENLLGRKDPYYGRRNRIFMTFEDNASKHGYLYNWYKVLLDTTREISTERLELINQEIYNSDIIEPGESGWDESKNVNGEIVEFMTEDSLRFIYAGLNGGQVENDHYPFYEFLFSINNGTVKLKKTNKFFTDIAGIEGIEYSSIEPIIMTLITIILFLVYSLIEIVRLIIKKKKILSPTKAIRNAG